MITIDIQPYCERCLEFSPDVEYPSRYFADNDEIIQSDTIIRCKYRKRCELIKRYLERQKS